MPMSPVAIPSTSPLSSNRDFGCSEARIDFNAKRFGLGAKIAADIAQRTDKIAVIVHQRRHEEIWQANAAGGAEQIELVLGDLYLERTVGIFAPAGSNLSRPMGSTTTPERIWAPISEPFSTTTTAASG